MNKKNRLIAPLILTGVLVVFITLGLTSHMGAFTAIGIFGAIFVVPIFLVLLLQKQRLAVQTPHELAGYLVTGDAPTSFSGDIPQSTGKLTIHSGHLQFISTQGQFVINLGPSDFKKIVFRERVWGAKSSTSGSLIIRIVGKDDRDVAIFSPISLTAFRTTQAASLVSPNVGAVAGMPAILEENKHQDQFQAMVTSLRSQFGDQVSQINADVSNLLRGLIIVGIITVLVFGTIGILLLVAK